jgi:hypothetical protein
LREYLDEATIWGGDWNQALEGREYVGPADGRAQIVALLEQARLSVPTRSLGSAVLGQRSIDHIALPMTWDVRGARRVRAEANVRRLSDHDLYVVSATP